VLDPARSHGCSEGPAGGIFESCPRLEENRCETNLLQEKGRFDEENRFHEEQDFDEENGAEEVVQEGHENGSQLAKRPDGADARAVY
jgi:hypothetical protein